MRPCYSPWCSNPLGTGDLWRRCSCCCFWFFADRHLKASSKHYCWKRWVSTPLLCSSFTSIVHRDALLSWGVAIKLDPTEDEPRNYRLCRYWVYSQIVVAKSLRQLLDLTTRAGFQRKLLDYCLWCYYCMGWTFLHDFRSYWSCTTFGHYFTESWPIGSLPVGGHCRYHLSIIAEVMHSTWQCMKLLASIPKLSSSLFGGQTLIYMLRPEHFSQLE